VRDDTLRLLLRRCVYTHNSEIKLCDTDNGQLWCSCAAGEKTTAAARVYAPVVVALGLCQRHSSSSAKAGDVGDSVLLAPRATEPVPRAPSESSQPEVRRLPELLSRVVALLYAFSDLNSVGMVKVSCYRLLCSINTSIVACATTSMRGSIEELLYGAQAAAHACAVGKRECVELSARLHVRALPALQPTLQHAT
jgi:hypothetical protein